MAIQRVNCPRCGTAANVPVGMASVRCSSCGSVWNPSEPTDQKHAADEASSAAVSAPKSSLNTAKLAGGVFSTLLVLAFVCGAVWYLSPATPDAVPLSDPTPKPVTIAKQAEAPPPESYREISLPESTRQKIYRDYRMSAGTSVEKPIPLPKEWKSRQALDATFNSILERELTLHASVHNISVDDVTEILKEGNAKQWK